MKEFFPLIVSILIGLLVGLEREKHHSPASALGIRTFTLLAITGFLAGWTQQIWLTISISVFSLLLVTISYYRETVPGKGVDFGLTTEIAAGIIFVLGYLSHQNPPFVAILGCLVWLLLAWKTPIHNLTLKIQRKELEAAALPLLIGIGVLSFLEDKVIDPWGLFNPRKFGLIVLLIAAIEFSSYLAVKIIGVNKSPLIMGFLAGLVSSTALILTTGKSSKDKPGLWKVNVVTAVVGQIASILELVFIVGLIADALILPLLLSTSGAIIIGGIAVVILNNSVTQRDSDLELRSPLDFWGVLRLAILMAGVLALVTFAQRFIGDFGRMAAAIFAGIFELHGVSLATATQFERSQLELLPAVRTISLALSMSLIAKIGIAWMSGRGHFSKTLTLVFMSMAAVVVTVTWIAFGF